MTRIEKTMRNWLLVTGAGYAAGALDIVARPRAAVVTLNSATANVAGGRRIAPEEPPGLYNSLAAAYMATIAALSLTASRDPSANRNLIPPLLVAKGASASALAYRYLRSRRPGFLAAAALDAALLGVTAGLYTNLDHSL
jgi:hypothetical protein